MDTYSGSPKTEAVEAVDQIAHQGAEDDLSDFEFALMRTFEGFARWQSECLGLVSDLAASGPEITLLNVIRMNDRPKTIKELARATNRTDIPNIQYSLRKLASAGLTRKQGAGRSGVTYSLTVEGCHVSERLQDIRGRLLLQALAGHPDLTRRLHSAAETLEELTELFGVAVRQAEARSGS